MAIYVANENGDWWGISEMYGKTLFVLDTDNINTLVMNAIREEWELEEDEDFSNIDKLEKIIWEYGKEIQLPL